VSALYQKEVGNHAAYYRESLRYLGCEELDSLSKEENIMQATLLGFAALLGEDIYNFGELLAHPILKYLEGPKERWLLELLYAFNAGDIAKFHSYETKWSQSTDMVNHRELLESKIRLLALMELAMTRPMKKRHIRFEEIAEKTLTPLDRIEFLVMRAFSKGLIRGSIDQIDSTVSFTWIQPRVLSLEQISAMAERINVWRKDVESMERLVQQEAKEIIIKT